MFKLRFKQKKIEIFRKKCIICSVTLREINVTPGVHRNLKINAKTFYFPLDLSPYRQNSMDARFSNIEYPKSTTVRRLVALTPTTVISLRSEVDSKMRLGG